MAGLKKMAILCGMEFSKGKCKDEEEKSRGELISWSSQSKTVNEGQVNDKDNVQVAITFTEQ